MTQPIRLRHRPKRRRPLNTTLLRLAQATATIAVTWFIVTRAGLSVEELRGLDPGMFDLHVVPLVASCVLLFIGYISTALIWALIVRDLGGPRLAGADAVRLFMIGNLGRYIPGKVWQIAALAALARPRGVPAATSTAAAILGQGTGLGAAMAIGLGAAWQYGAGEAWRWVIPGLVLGGTMLGLIPPVFDTVSRLWFRLAKTDAPEGLSTIHGARWVLSSLLSWVVYAVSFWLFTRGLGFDVGLVAGGAAFAAAYVLGYLVVFAPAGLGVREGFLIALLSSTIGVGGATALAAAARLWTTIVEVVPATVFWARHLAEDGVTGSGE